jgi:hypothetical protein
MKNKLGGYYADGTYYRPWVKVSIFIVLKNFEYLLFSLRLCKGM